MNIDLITALFDIFNPIVGIKFFLATLIFFYLIFALVVLRQTQLMTEVLNEVQFSPFLKLLSTLHFLSAIAVFILTLILLFS